MDCFAGSGIVGLMAIKHNRDFILIEKHKPYIELIKARIEHEKNKPVQQKLL